MIAAALAETPIAGLHIIDFDLPGVYRWKRSLASIHWHYYLWQIKAYFVARQLHRKIGFDVVHHVTYVRYASPSFLALLSVPFIWGPIGGGEVTPKAFWQDFTWRSKLYEMLRDGVRLLGEKDPFVRLTADRSRIAYATTADTADRLLQLGCSSVKLLSQVGFSPEEIDNFVPHSSPNPDAARLISIGRLLHWKGFHLALEAFAQAHFPPTVEYWIVGQGVEETGLRRLATRLGVATQVQFLPEMPRSQLLATLATCAALIHPSLHESGGFVCLEAMAIGCPVICLDLGGPAVQVTDETGIKIPAHTPQQVVADLAEAITRLVSDPDLRSRLGQAGQCHAQQIYRWQTKAAVFSQAYQELLSPDA
jgi:glycosyltransferase involved in cell wall biosynthesis